MRHVRGTKGSSQVLCKEYDSVYPSAFLMLSVREGVLHYLITLHYLGVTA